MSEYYYKQTSVRFGPGRISPVVRNLIIANVAVFVIQCVFDYVKAFPFDAVFGLSPAMVFHGYLWQIGTYMFLHAEPMHLLMNMFFLWMFGTEVELTMGWRRFTTLYFISGLGAGLLTCLFPPFWRSHIIGASGAAFAVMIAYGLLFPDRMVLIFFIIPMRALYMAIFMVAIEVAYMMWYMQGGGVAHVTHVAGALIGYLYMKYGLVPSKASMKKKEAARVRIAAAAANESKRVDEILDKINREGMHKLSRSDRNFLKQRAAQKKKQK